MIVVYTAIFGGYDKLIPVEPVKGVRFVAFTDAEYDVNGWESIRPTKTESSNRLENRKYKALSHKLFPSADYTIYIDGNLELKTSPYSIIEKCKNGFNVFRHNKRNCAYQEAETVKNFVDKKTLDKQIKMYKKNNFPINYGLFWCGFIVRDNNVSKLNESWWNITIEGIERDQISFPFAVYINNCDSLINIISGDIPFHGGSNEFVKRYPHKK